MIVAVPPNTLTQPQKALLNKKGYVVIETAEPEKIKIITPDAPINANDYLMAALHALSKDNSMNGNTLFIKELYRRLSDNEIKTKSQTNDQTH